MQNASFAIHTRRAIHAPSGAIHERSSIHSFNSVNRAWRAKPVITRFFILLLIDEIRCRHRPLRHRPRQVRLRPLGKALPR